VVLALTIIGQYRTMSVVIRRELELVRVIGSIVHLDEVLTMSVRMAAATGDGHWAERYHEHEPRLAGAIARARTLADRAGDERAIELTDVANAALIDLERRALEHVERGELESARSLVLGASYARRKGDYAGGVDELRRSIESRVRGRMRLVAGVTVISGVLACVGLAASGGLLLRTMHRHRREGRAKDELVMLARRGTMGELSASLAHELNQPLAAITNYCEAGLAFAADPEADPGDLRRALTGARDEAARAGAIIRQIRSFARGDDGLPRRLEVAELVRSSLVLVRSEARQVAVAVEVHEPEVGAVVEVDAVRLQQVLVNLLVNAIDACRLVPAGARRVVVRWWNEDRWVIISVRDTGPGIDPEARERLFEPFFSTKAEGLGLGLGLSLSRGLVEAAGGRLECVDGHDGSDGPIDATGASRDRIAGAELRVILPLAH